MKQALLLIILMFSFRGSNAQNLSSGKTTTSIEATEDGYTVKLEFSSVSVLNAEGDWSKINVPGTVNMLEAGAPQMPYKAFSLLLPEGDIQLSVKSATYTDYFNYDIIPSKGNLNRTQDPSKIPLVKGPVYQQDAFFPAQIATVANEYAIRKAHGRAFHVFPVQYNPVTHTVRIYHSLEVAVKTNQGVKPAEATTNHLWDNIYKHQFLNYDLLQTVAAKSTYSAPTETGDMLIVTPQQYIGILQDFINWKEERGIHCFIMNMDTVTSGADPDSIQARIAWHYQQNNNLNYVVLVGDESDIPPMENVDLAGPSDAAYGYVAGNDHYPDLLVGRFSANNLNELNPQLTKSIEYEKNPTAATNWYKRAMGIASNEGPGDDSQMDWEHMVGIRQQLLGATFNYVYEAYDDTHDINIAPLDNPGNPDEQEVIDAINAGVSLINYCGHGSSTSMATTGFSNNDVADLANTNGEWPFIVTVACVTGEFMNGNTSLGEKLMIAIQSGQPYGMVGGFMSSINQYWDPPMQGQDEMNEIITNISTTKLYAAAAITAAGAMSMNDAYTGAGYDMTDTWIFFGDPSLQLRYDAWDALTAVHEDSIFFYETNTGVDLNKEYGTVVLMHNGEIYSVQTATSFNTSHTFAALPAGDSLIVVATAPNTKPYYGKIRIVDTATPTAIVNVNQGNNLILYPNPARNTVTVKGIDAETTFRCLDITGRLILEGKLDAVNNRLNTGNIPAGSYILQLESKGQKTNLPLQILR
jgi:gingipain R